MSFSVRTFIICLAALIQCVAGYALVEDYTPSNFFEKFTFFTEPDPTSGHVQYVDESTAQGSGLISQSDGSIYMGVDHTNMAPNGRASVRITSKAVYNHGLIILDLAHMPTGCGTWPAFWTLGPTWPEHGEIDIIEGVNSQDYNAMTLHTGPSCSVSDSGLFDGVMATSNCDVNAYDQPYNAGCSIDHSDPSSYGAGLNAIDGGVYATEWNSDGIAIYFFPRGAIPSDITAGKPDPSIWGKPAAHFQGACDMDTAFSDQQIVFDTTFCGDWGSGAWSTDSTCSAKSYSCEDYVANNPEAFKDAFWKINSLKVYQTHGGSKSAPKPYLTHTNAGPTGIASSLPPQVSSLAPIPVSTQNIETSWAAPTPAANTWNTWNTWAPSPAPTTWNAWAAAAPSSASVNTWDTWAAAAAPSSAAWNSVNQFGAAAPSPTTWPAPVAAVTSAPVSPSAPYSSPVAVPAAWFPDGSQSIPASTWPQPTGAVYKRHARHIRQHQKHNVHAARALIFEGSDDAVHAHHHHHEDAPSPRFGLAN